MGRFWSPPPNLQRPTFPPDRLRPRCVWFPTNDEIQLFLELKYGVSSEEHEGHRRQSISDVVESSIWFRALARKVVTAVAKRKKEELWLGSGIIKINLTYSGLVVGRVRTFSPTVTHESKRKPSRAGRKEKINHLNTKLPKREPARRRRRRWQPATYLLVWCILLYTHK